MGEGGIADIVERVVPSVVNISMTRASKRPDAGFPPFFPPFFGPDSPFGPEMPGERRDQGMGSGVIVSNDGIVLTNNHVVENAEEITVTTHDKREFQAEVVGSDKKSDLAVIRLKGEVSGLVPIALGDSSRLRLGDVVIAIGNPFGVGQTVTMGIVSAKGRSDLGIIDYEDFIQTDAAINPGNSGGALVDMEGSLVGINTAILSRSGGNQGIGFAIPTEMAGPILQSLLEHGRVERGWLGVAIQDVNQDLARALKLPAPKGVLLSEVKPGGPADKGGLERGDVIVKLNGVEVESSGRLRNLVASAGAKSRVQVELIRDGRTKSVSLKLGTMDDGSERAEGAPADASVRPKELDGLGLEPLDDRTRARFRIDKSVRAGVLVTSVTPGSAAGRGGVRRGDVILEVQQQPVRSVEEFSRIYRSAKGSALLLVHRRGSTLFVAIGR